MARLIFEDLTIEQAEELAHWYEGQGEQDAYYWMDANGLETPQADIENPNWLTITKDEVVVRMR